ncbi:hypothetical protein YC2023_026205 [Brassica napus]
MSLFSPRSVPVKCCRPCLTRDAPGTFPSRTRPPAEPGMRHQVGVPVTFIVLLSTSLKSNFSVIFNIQTLCTTLEVRLDIKGANLLVDASGVVKLADFGMAKHLTGQRADLSLKGSPFWMAPELMQAVMQRDSNPDLAFAVDIWSLGCTIIEMFTGKPPWSEFEGVERPTASMLLEHRFLNNSSVLSTSPRNSDVSQLFNGMNITEPNSRRGKPNFKLDQVPRARNVTSSERSSFFIRI